MGSLVGQWDRSLVPLCYSATLYFPTGHRTCPLVPSYSVLPAGTPYLSPRPATIQKGQFPRELTCGLRFGAGDGNRTHDISLEG
jgi:hypothetical protein